MEFNTLIISGRPYVSFELAPGQVNTIAYYRYLETVEQRGTSQDTREINYYDGLIKSHLIRALPCGKCRFAFNCPLQILLYG